MQDDSGCCGGGGDGIATADGRGRDGLTLCLESACPVLGGASTVARTGVWASAPKERHRVPLLLFDEATGHTARLWAPVGLCSDSV